jgi:hypothetical protein
MIPASLERLRDKHQADELDSRMFKGLAKVVDGEITQEAFRDGLKKLFAPQMGDQWRWWMAETLFICQKDTRKDTFLTRDEGTIWRDQQSWYKFQHLAFLTCETEYDEFAKVKKFAKILVEPGIKFRQQFLNQNGNVPSQQPTALQEEWDRLDQAFSTL